jgi:hypothetical protein
MIITLYKAGADGRTFYYTIHDRQQLLDAPFALCAAFRVGMGAERERLHRFESLAERDRLIRSLIKKRLRDGYRLLYTFSRSGFASEEGLGEAIGLAKKAIV